jgi:outer membrane protein assembly factor BamB
MSSQYAPAPREVLKTPVPPENLTWAGRWLGNIVLAWLIFLAAAIGYTHWIRDDQPGLANLVLLAGSALMVLTICIYTLLQGGKSWALRWLPTLLTGLAVGAFFTFFEVSGNTGNMWPVVRPRFSLRTAPVAIEKDIKPAEVRGDDLARGLGHDFPQFLGPDRNQVLTGTRLARDWQATPPKLLWKKPVGAGWSGFAVVGTRAVTLEQRDENELVICYDLLTGEILWTHSHVGVRFYQPPGGVGPRSTPTIHNGRVYALGATGIFDCLDLRSGELKWSHNVLEDDPLSIPEWGKANSPLIVDHMVVVVGGIKALDAAGAVTGYRKTLIAYDAESGKEIWSGGEHFGSYSSPALVTLNGERQIAVVNQDWIDGFDLKTGEVLWSMEWPGPTNSFANTAQVFAVDEQRLFVSKEYGTGGMLFNVIRDEAGKWTATKETVNGKTAWAKPVLKTKVNNVSRSGDYLYGFDGELLECVELETGRIRWKQRGNFGSGQLLLVENLLLVQTEDGALLLVAADPKKFQEIARVQALDGTPCWNPPAFAPPYLLVRNEQEAACYELPLEAAANAATQTD